MKLSAKTIAILNNFSTINPSLLIKPGSTLRTISAQKTVMAKAEVEETFDREFAIYDLKQFLSALSLFKEPEIEFEDKFLRIKSGRNGVKFYYAAPELVVSPPDKKIELPSVDVEFELSDSQLTSIFKGLSALAVPDVVVEGTKGDSVVVAAMDTKNSSTNRFDIEIEDVKPKTNFRVIFKADNLKLVPGSYDVSVSAKKMASFVNEPAKITYFIAAEATSTFG